MPVDTGSGIRHWLSPSFEGHYTLRQPAPELLHGVAERVATGLLPMAPASRNRYQVTERDGRSLRFLSTTAWTGINIGLNDVELELGSAATEVRYRVRYWTWARYALGLGIVICAPMIALLVLAVAGLVDIPAEWIAPPRQMLIFGLPMLVFWALVWPWILVLVHKRPAARCLEKILAEVAADGSPAADGGALSV